MVKRNGKRISLIVILIVISQVAFYPEGYNTEDISGIEDQVRLIVPISIEMVDKTISVLSKGWKGMTPTDKALFNQLFDPGNTGGVDKTFIDDVLKNYQRIHRRLDGSLVLAYKQDSDRCEGKRLHYTDLIKIYVCPYFTVEDSTDRKARVLIHETAHMALLVVDRPYFHKNTYSTRYEALTPRGSWTTGIPLLGSLFREITHGDTLYHPDAYAWFAVELTTLSELHH